VFKLKNNIFKNRNLLTDSYIPPDIIGRDIQIADMGSNLQPILDNPISDPINMFIHGENGTGKTICTNYVVQMLNEGITALGLDITIDLIKLNCAVEKTDTDILSAMLSQFGIKGSPLGYSSTAVMQWIWDTINEKAKTVDSYAVLFFFDEIDKLNANRKKFLKSDKAQLDLVYQIIRAIEYGLLHQPNCKIGIIAASNKPQFLDSIERSINSSVAFYRVKFPNYNENELYSILMDRIEAFQPEAMLPDLIRYVARDVAERYRGDARRAMKTLSYAGKFALDDGSNAIYLKHIIAAEQKITHEINEEALSDYSKHDKFLFVAIDIAHRYTSEPNTGLIIALYESICKIVGETPVSDRQVTRNLSSLADDGVIDFRKGNKGNTRIFSLSTSVQQSMGVLYTEDLKNGIEKSIIDIEIIIGHKVKQKKNAKLNMFT